MKKFFVHIGTYILRGILAVIPIFLCWISIWLLEKFIDEQVLKFLSHYIDIRQIPGLGIVLLLACLYIIGLIFSNVLGIQVLKIIDGVASRIPIIKIIYGVGKQFSDTLSVADPQKQAFKKAVFVEAFNGQGWMLGFITGSLKGPAGEDLFNVYVPSSPHPLTGIVFMVKPSQVMDCGWTVEEALKMVVSIGIISPEEVKKIS
ncbi:MAG: DUF502 domain-containing protein [Candidatus Omnitrophica bacterium]|nr:DUF502 domain-containing protein [Candidatus Omnitrophota bacterium]MDE2222851.1 DUF502 domain-containing protein [Candidatus Omnitrophota bacterium]